MLSAVLCFCVSTAVAIPISEYHKTLEHVVADLQSLLKQEDNETDADYESRFTDNIEAIRSELPPTQPVEFDKGKWNADNSWLHTSLDELQQTTPEQRHGKITSILESLRALQERVKDLENAQQVGFDKNAANEKLKGILARPEYATSAKGENALAKLLQDFVRWLRNLFPKRRQVGSGNANVISAILQIVVVVAALGLIVYVLYLLITRFRRPIRTRIRKKREARIVLGEKLEPDATATDLLSEAEALARSGDLRAAIRKGYIALLVELGDRKLISLAQHKTNRDYLRSVSTRPQLHSRMQGLTDSFERHWYGFAQVTPTDWQDFRSGYREALQSGN